MKLYINNANGNLSRLASVESYPYSSCSEGNLTPPAMSTPYGNSYYVDHMTLSANFNNYTNKANSVYSDGPISSPENELSQLSPASCDYSSSNVSSPSAYYNHHNSTPDSGYMDLMAEASTHTQQHTFLPDLDEIPINNFFGVDSGVINYLIESESSEYRSDSFLTPAQAQSDFNPIESLSLMM